MTMIEEVLEQLRRKVLSTACCRPAPFPLTHPALESHASPRAISQTDDNIDNQNFGT